MKLDEMRPLRRELNEDEKLALWEPRWQQREEAIEALMEEIRELEIPICHT